MISRTTVNSLLLTKATNVSTMSKYWQCVYHVILHNMYRYFNNGRPPSTVPHTAVKLKQTKLIHVLCTSLHMHTVEALWADTLVSGQLYLWPPWQNPVRPLAHTNSVFTYSHKRPARIADTFFTSRGCPLMRASTDTIFKTAANKQHNSPNACVKVRQIPSVQWNVFQTVFILVFWRCSQSGEQVPVLANLRGSTQRVSESFYLIRN